MKTPTKTYWKTGYAAIGLLLFTAGLSTPLVAAEHHYSGSGHHKERRTESMSSGHRHEYERSHHKHDHRFREYGHHRHAPGHFPVRFVPPPLYRYHPLRVVPEPRTSSGIRVWIQLPWLLLE